MTCIVGYVDKESGLVYIGGDSGAVAENFLMPRKEAKVFRRGDFIFGYCGSFRMGNLLEFSFVPPESEVYDRHYMCTTFVNALRKCFLEGGVAEVENNVETGGSFLVATGDTLYEVDEDYNIGEYITHFFSVGIGSEFAMGAMHAIEEIDSIIAPTKRLSAEEKVILALESASAYTGSVCGPHHVVNTGD